MKKLIEAECPSCFQMYRVSPEVLQKKVFCKKCKETVQLNRMDPSDVQLEYSALPLTDKDITVLKQVMQYEFATKEQIQKGLSIYHQKNLANETVELGQIFLENKIISQNEYNFIFSYQKMTEITEKDRSFAALAIKNRMLTLDQIENAFKEQAKLFKESKTITLLGDILVESGQMSPSYRDAILARQKRLEVTDDELSFGAIAVRMGFCSPDQIKSALVLQEAEFNVTNKLNLLGNILVETNVIAHRDLEMILKRQKELKEQKRIADQSKDQAKTNAQQNVFSLEDAISVTVSPDAIDARLEFKKNISELISIEDVKLFISKKGIKYGLVESDILAKVLKQQDDEQPQSAFVIAKGKPPINPQDANIKYFFDNDPAKISLAKKGHIIDYVTIPTLPAVKQGTVLAEKIPGIEGNAGINVYSELIEVNKPNEILLRQCVGTQITTDQKQIVAQTDGIPIALIGWKVCVLQQKNIANDINASIGNVNYDGILNIQGSINEGAQVKAKMLFAKNITKADIDIEGDIIVTESIIGSKIKTRGKIRAGLIRSSNVQAFDHIAVEKSIVNSKIECMGHIIVQKGKIIASELTALKGIYALHVGTPETTPCKLNIGLDSLLTRKLERIQNAIPSKKKEGAEIHQQFSEWKQKLQHTEAMIAKLTSTEPNSEHIVQLQKNRTIILNTLAKYQQGLQVRLQAIRAYDEEKEIYTELLLREKPNSILEVSGQLEKGTIVSGKNSSLVIAETVSNVSVIETKRDNNQTSMLLCAE